MERLIKPFEILLIAAVLLDQCSYLVAGLSCNVCKEGVIHNKQMGPFNAIIDSQKHKIPKWITLPPKPPAGSDKDYVIPGLCANVAEDNPVPVGFEPTSKPCDSPDSQFCVTAKLIPPVPTIPSILFSKCLTKEEAAQASCDEPKDTEICICNTDWCNTDKGCECKLNSGGADPPKSEGKGKGPRIIPLDLITFIAITCIIKLWY